MGEVPDRQAIRDELEATRRAYHQLLSSLSPDDWRRKSGNPDLTVKELMWHMAWSLGWITRSVDAVLHGRNFNPPGFLVEPARALAMRWLARRATPEAAAHRYEESHAALLDRIANLPQDAWQQAANRFGEIRTVEWYFRHVAEHFDEHATDVRAGLGRA